MAYKLRWKKVKAESLFTIYTHKGLADAAMKVSTSMTNNPKFANAPASLATIPSLVESINANFITGELTINQSLSIASALQYYEQQLLDVLTEQTEYVNQIAQGDIATIQSAGMEIISVDDQPNFLRNPFSKHV